jgi:hypothetical protein
VTASSGLKVVMVDQNDAILKKSVDAIDKSIGRVAKKKVPDDTKVCVLLIVMLFIHHSTGTSGIQIGHNVTTNSVDRSKEGRIEC